jgi:hypothetical protein
MNHLTITVRKTAAAQTVQTTDGPVVVQPGESITAEFDAVQEAAVRSAPGPFEVAKADKPKAK